MIFKVELLQPKPGWVEMDPEKLWTSVVIVLKEAISGIFSCIENDLLIFFQVSFFFFRCQIDTSRYQMSGD